MQQLPTTLPNDFFERVQAKLREQKPAENNAVEQAIIAVLHRPLTLSEKWALIDSAAGNSPGVTLNQQIVDRIARGGRA